MSIDKFMAIVARREARMMSRLLEDVLRHLKKEN